MKITSLRITLVIFNIEILSFSKILSNKCYTVVTIIL